MASTDSNSGRVLIQEDSTHAVPKKLKYENYLEECSIEIKTLTRDEIEFCISGVPTCFTNSIRRSVMAEVPTMAIDRIEISNNTSIVFDEMLSHRLGQIPIKVDPDKFDFRTHVSDPLTEKNCIAFTLKVKCPPGPDRMNVYSKDLKWIPVEQQKFIDDEVPAPVHPDILIAKLNPGQVIDLKVFCLKGCGKEHAKFSPAAPVNIKPTKIVEFNAPIQGDIAHRLKSMYGDGIEVRAVNGVDTAFVAKPLAFDDHWKIFRDPELKNMITISLDRNNYIFTLEGSGCMPTKDTVSEGIRIVRDGWKSLLDALTDI